jgi:two-component system cell cycle sensor histidine kinase/response regulator CckA
MVLAGGEMQEQPRETVPVADDEAFIRKILTAALSDKGYTVLQAYDGVDGLAVVKAHAGEPIELLVTDIRMPRMDGPELAERLRATHPGLKVILISSHTVHPQDLKAYGGEFLEKPIPLNTFTAKVREVLDQPTDL